MNLGQYLASKLDVRTRSQVKMEMLNWKANSEALLTFIDEAVLRWTHCATVCVSARARLANGR